MIKRWFRPRYTIVSDGHGAFALKRTLGWRVHYWDVEIHYWWDADSTLFEACWTIDIDKLALWKARYEA